MARAIWKYVLEPDTTITMPKGAEMLSVHAQSNASVCLWALVETDTLQTEKRRFAVYATGEKIPETEYVMIKKFLGTVLLHDGLLVFHAFERALDDL